MKTATDVYLVLGTSAGEAALALPQDAPVWIVNSPQNAVACSVATAAGRPWTLLFANGTTPQDWFLNHVDTVDQHHNEYSSKQPYANLHVLGAQLTDEVQVYLREFGFVAFISAVNGFICSKTNSQGSPPRAQ